MKIFRKKTLNEPYLSEQTFKKKYPLYHFGKNSYGVPEVFDWGENTTLKIGNYCSISANVKIYLGGHHRADWISSYPFPAFFQSIPEINDYGGSNGNVIIKSDVWIAANVIILSGVTIGNGAVIANGSVVTKDVNDYEIVGGNPAKHIRYRFTKELREELLQINWWDWETKEIIENQELFCTTDINKLRAYRKTRSN